MEGTAEAEIIPRGGFSNLSELDVVDKLPTTPADERIRYDEHPLTFGDLRLPEQETDDGHPLVILIHGGQWESSFSLDYMAPLAEALTEVGVATWNIEFRRLNNPGGGFPGTFEDASHGIDFVRHLADQYPIDLDRVVVMGHSSGGHLAAWAAGRKNLPRDSELAVEDPLPIRGVVDLAGVLDLEHAYQAGRDDILDLVEPEDSDSLHERFAATSPFELLPMGVPQTLIVGNQDNPWRMESHERYEAAAREGGDAIDLVTLDGANHFDVVDPCSSAWAPIVSAVFTYTEKPIEPGVLKPDAGLCTTGEG